MKAISMGKELMSNCKKTILKNMLVDMIVATICLYTESTWGINMVKECIVLLLSGASIPLAFFPAGLRNIVQYLPFRCIYDTPLSVLLQKNGYTWGTGLLSSLLLQLAWCIALGIIGSVFWRVSLKKIISKYLGKGVER